MTATPANPLLDRVLTAIDQRRTPAIEDLKKFLRIPSVSTKKEHAGDCQKCADWLAGELRLRGATVTVESTPGRPIVLARTPHVPNKPTVLFYGHYDVQPPEPLSLWTTPPFDPAVRDNAIYARGACDDKGQVWAHVEALGAWQSVGGLPVNVVMLIEGEEEIGSEHLAQFVQARKNDLKADVALVSDTGQFARGIPAITYGLRGLVYEEVFLTGPSHDLHSGIYGGAVPNPANVLAQLIASLHDTDGKVAIPGFYDDVLDLTEEERTAWSALPFDEFDFLRGLGLSSAAGERNYSTLERRWARPTCDVNGLTAGYQGEGAKTVIASKASAKISMRLVPNQDPAKIRVAFESAMKARCPENVKIEFAQHGAAAPVLVPLNSRAAQLAAQAVHLGFGAAPVFMREGGSIPVVGLLKRELGLDTLLVGFALPDDRVHSPNEKFDLDALYKGSRTAAAIYAGLANLFS